MCSSDLVMVDGRPLPGVLASWPQVAAVLGELAVRYPRVWQDDADALRTEVVDLLAALRLARRMDEGLAVFPFAARYQPQVRTLTQEVPG